MATKVNKWISDKGEVLIPLEVTTYNTSPMVSDGGTYWFAVTEEVVAIETGNPIGLLLTLTYP